jgi:hypothetical protein
MAGGASPSLAPPTTFAFYRSHLWSYQTRGIMSIQSTGLGDDERLVVSPRRARHMLDCGNTRLYELLAAGELDSFLDGRSRKITVDSIHRYIARRLARTEATNTAPQPRRRGWPPKVNSTIASTT